MGRLEMERPNMVSNAVLICCDAERSVLEPKWLSLRSCEELLLARKGTVALWCRCRCLSREPENQTALTSVATACAS